MSFAKSWSYAYLIFATLLLVSGCGQSVPSISGTVTYNDEPIETGYISFQPEDGRGQSFAARIENGKYNATERVTPGMKRVLVTGFRESAPITREESQQSAEKGISGPTDYIAEDAEVNSKQVEIMPGDQTIDFSITGVPRPE